MGMTAHYVRISEIELKSILNGNTSKVDSLLEELDVSMVPAGSGKGDFLCRAYAGGAKWPMIEKQAAELNWTEADLAREINSRGLHLWLDLDKLYNELHLLLTGEDFPLDLPETDNLLSLALIASESIEGTEEYGYGPARYIKPAMVKRIAAELSSKSYEQLCEQNGISAEECGFDDEDFKVEFDGLKSFYESAADNQQAVVLIFL
jgi:hypothetical protein